MPRHSSSSAVGQRVRGGGRVVCVGQRTGEESAKEEGEGSGEGEHWESGGEGTKIKSEDATTARHS